MKKYKVYCGFTDWFVAVEASSMEEAIEKGHQKMVKRIQDAKEDVWANEVPTSPVSRGGNDAR